MSEAKTRKALADLVAALDLVHASPEYEAVYRHAARLCGPYTGPKYEAELERARAALAVKP